MNKVVLFLACASLTVSGAYAQKKLVDEVRKDVSALTTNVDTYKAAINKLKPAFTNPETKDNVEAWLLGGDAGFGMYDKCFQAKTIGQTVDDAAAGRALLEGYDYYMKALPLDSVKETEKDGTVKLDKKTGLPKVKTKYSKTIIDHILGHLNDFLNVGNDLYNAKDWANSAKAWGIFCDWAKSDAASKLALADSTVAQVRFYQGCAYYAGENYKAAVKSFEQARALGYEQKEVYDYALACLANLKDEAGIVALAGEAFKKCGDKDPQYINILINNFINKKDYAQANKLLDEAIATNPNNADIQNLKGIIVEHESGIEEALPYFKKAVELAPESSKCLFDLGRYYYNQTVKIQQENPNLSGKALSAKVKPLYEQALPYLEKAYKVDPQNTDAKVALRNIYYQLGDEAKLNEIENAK